MDTHKEDGGGRNVRIVSVFRPLILGKIGLLNTINIDDEIDIDRIIIIFGGFRVKSIVADEGAAGWNVGNTIEADDFIERFL